MPEDQAKGRGGTTQVSPVDGDAEVAEDERRQISFNNAEDEEEDDADGC